jgi:hypothetical protein
MDDDSIEPEPEESLDEELVTEKPVKSSPWRKKKQKQSDAGMLAFIYYLFSQINFFSFFQRPFLSYFFCLLFYFFFFLSFFLSSSSSSSFSSNVSNFLEFGLYLIEDELDDPVHYPLSNVNSRGSSPQKKTFNVREIEGTTHFVVETLCQFSYL